MNNNIYDRVIKQQAQALELMKAGLRVPLVHSMTSVSLRALRSQWKEIYGEDSVPGRMPASVLACIEKGQSPMIMSTAVSAYLAVQDTNRGDVVDTFLLAWNITKKMASDADINAAWYAIRDTKAGLVLWVECNSCEANHIFAVELKKTNSCPYCGSTDHKLSKVSV